MAKEAQWHVQKFSDYVQAMRSSFGTFKWVWNELISPEGRRWSKRMFIILAVMQFIIVLQPLAFAWLVEASTGRNKQAVYLTAGVLLVLILVQQALSYVQAQVREWAWNRNILQVRSRINALFHEKTLGQHLEEGSTLAFSNIEKSQSRIETIQHILLFEAGAPIIRLVLAFAFLWVASSVVGFIGLVLLAVYVVWSLYLNHHVLVETTPIEAQFRAQNRQVVERWEKVARVKTSGKSVPEADRLKEWLVGTLMRDWRFWAQFFINQSAIRDLLALAVRVVIIAYGVHLVLTGQAEASAMLIPLYVWTTDISQNLWQIGHTERRLGEQVPYIESLRTALTMSVAFHSHEGEELLHNKPISVRFENVNLSYPSGHEVLRNVSFAIHPGEKVALLGPSGAGKTSVMKLLLRYMDPTAGKIWVNGNRLVNVRLDSWMQHVGYIAQHPQVFDGTVRYNLLFGLPEERKRYITDAEIWNTMRLLQIDFGSRLTHGLDTVVGKDGMKLSGGEAQRLLIGAAVIKQPLFMIIDEATSSLDSSTERLVQDGLQNVLTEHVGALIVAHRLSTVRDVCNKFLVLRPLEEVGEGEAQIEAEASTFDELYRLSPTFRRLADDQGVKV